MKSQSRLRIALFALVTALLTAFYAFRVWDTPAYSCAYGEVRYSVAQPRALGVLLVLPLLLMVAQRSLTDLPAWQRALGGALRALFIGCIALALAGTTRQVPRERTALVVLVDVSDSVPDTSLTSVLSLLKQVQSRKRADDWVQVVRFADHAELISDPDPSRLVASALRFPRQENGPPPGAATRIQAAFELAYALLPPGFTKRIALFSDGIETVGDAQLAASRAAELQAQVFVFPFKDPPPAELSITHLNLPSKVQVGQTFDLVADIYSTRISKAKLRLYQNELLNGLGGVQEVTLDPGTQAFTFRSVVRAPGTTSYRLELEPLGEDHFKENNHFSAAIEVPGLPKVLFVDRDPSRSSYLPRALTAQRFDVEVRSPAGFPTTLSELEAFDFVILSDLPRDAFGADSLLSRYVREFGGGLLFAGGAASYGPGGWAGSELETLLPVYMNAEHQREMPGVAMALLIDRSGSMTGEPLEMAKTACLATLGALQNDDLLEVIAFDSSPTRFVKLSPARYRSRIESEISRIAPGGGTEIFGALDMAYQDLSVVSARKKHVILLTDGQAPPQGIRELLSAMVSEAITVTSVGLGPSTNGELLRSLAEGGGGRYHQAPDPGSLPRIFTRETEFVAKQANITDYTLARVARRADFLKGVSIDAAPPLRGYAVTQLKPGAELVLATESGHPLLARIRQGSGFSLAWTSDVKNHYAIDWLTWAGFSKFWGQLVREHQRSQERSEIPLQVSCDGEEIHATVDIFTAQGEFDNRAKSELYVLGPGPKDRRKIEFELVGPGRYTASLPLIGFGSYVLKADHFRTSEAGVRRQIAKSSASLNVPYPAEYAHFEPNTILLEHLAARSGGKINPSASEILAPASEPLRVAEPLTNPLILASIALFLADLAARRLRFRWVNSTSKPST